MEPIFDVKVINPELYDRVPSLKSVKIYRHQLVCMMKEFLLKCPNKEARKDLLDNAAVTGRKHILMDVEFYCLRDLVDVSQGGLVAFVQETFELFWRHIRLCKHCSSLASQCQVCRNNDKLFPFNVASVVRCKRCAALFHRKCFFGSSQKSKQAGVGVCCPACGSFATTGPSTKKTSKSNSSVLGL